MILQVRRGRNRSACLVTTYPSVLGWSSIRSGWWRYFEWQDWNFAPKICCGKSVDVFLHIYCVYIYYIHTIPTIEPNWVDPFFSGGFNPKRFLPKTMPHLVASGNTSFSSLTAKRKASWGFPKGYPVLECQTQNPKQNTGWWFQPIWNILVKMGIFPGVKIKNDWNHHLENRFGLLRGGYMCSPFSARNVGETSLRFPSLFATMMSLVKGRYLRHSKNGHFRYPYLVFLGVVGSFTLKRMNISFQRLGKYI